MLPSSEAKNTNLPSIFESQVAPPAKNFDLGLFVYKSHSITIPFNPVVINLLFLFNIFPFFSLA
jgi:hypothetical protein